MIIWGWKAREKNIGDGTFYCPQCGVEAMYSHMEINRYFTLYFIPLFQTSFLGDYVECHRCRGQFDSAVLQLTREQIIAMKEPWTCGICGNSNPPGYGECVNCGRPRMEA